MNRLLARLPRPGRRGGVLLTFAVVWVLIGVDLLTRQSGGPMDRGIFYENLPLWVRGALWVGTATAAAMFATRRTGKDAIGFVFLAVMPLLRVVGMGGSAVLWLATGGESGDVRGWIGAPLWAAILIVLWIVAGWAESRSETTGHYGRRST